MLLPQFVAAGLVLFQSTPTELETMNKKVAIVGGGSVGSTLALSLISSRVDVVIAARNPDTTKEKLAANLETAKLRVLDQATAIAEAQILILATPSLHRDNEIEDLAKSLGDVKGKSIIDATNPLSTFPEGLQIRWGSELSGGEVLANALPDSKVYKAFNSLGVRHMTKDAAKGVAMMYAGPDRDIADVIAAVGFNPYYVGGIRYARNLEAMAEMWIHIGIDPLPGQNWGTDWTFDIHGNPKDT